MTSELLPTPILGVDYGLRRVGLAVCDKDHRLAVGAGWLEGLSGRKLIRAILAAAKERNARQIMIGSPSGSGRDGQLVAKGADDLSAALSAKGMTISRWDESYSTAAVLSDIKRTGGAGRTKKGRIDEAAAVLILQGFLDSQRKD